VTRLRRELERTYHFQGVVGTSKGMRDLFEKVHNAAQHDSHVLILGESGTGKDLVARTIHYNGVRAKGPFISVNCAALPGELIESELFGYRKGAFTGATSDSVGLFRAAHGGTIFLDEIVEMPPATQSKLLRVLQDKKVRPVGGTEEIPVDVRVLCATNRDIHEATKEKAFRKDLFYRVSVITFEIPPLRDRREDIPLLVDHFLRKFNERFGKSIKRVEPAALEVLKDYRWEGNVRELENAIESAFAMGQGATLKKRDFPGHVVESAEKDAAEEQGVTTLRDMEKEMVQRAMGVSRGNKSKAARLLGITRKRLYNLMDRYGIAK
jgi:transcriptional regulator with PAS, ATPase and Fis domain